MQCKKAHQFFGFYLDGELTFEEEELIDAHLESCPGCFKEFRGLQRTRDLLLHLPQEDPGEEYTQAVMRRVREARTEEFAPVRAPLGERLAAWFGLWLAPKPAMGVGVALVLGIAAGLGVTQLTGSPTEQVVVQADRVSDPVEQVQPAPARDFAGADRSGEGVTSLPFRGQQVVYADQQGQVRQRVEFVLEPFILREGPQQVAEPLFPPAQPRQTEGSRDGARVTF
jgi:anti-sigma factor RsiW